MAIEGIMKTNGRWIWFSWSINGFHIGNHKFVSNVWCLLWMGLRIDIIYQSPTWRGSKQCDLDPRSDSKLTQPIYNDPLLIIVDIIGDYSICIYIYNSIFTPHQSGYRCWLMFERVTRERKFVLWISEAWAPFQLNEPAWGKKKWLGDLLWACGMGQNCSGPPCRFGSFLSNIRSIRSTDLVLLSI